MREHDLRARRRASAGAVAGAGASGASVVRLRPMRTLVIARDLAFRQRALTIFAELGFVAFAVASLDAPPAVVELVRDQRVDVVVLDATGCLGALGPVAVALCAAAPRVGIVIVSDETDRGGHALPVLPKWGWASDLIQAVKDAYRTGNPLKEDLSDARS